MMRTARTRVRPALLAAVLGSASIGGLLALEHVAPTAAKAPVTVINTVNQGHEGNNNGSLAHCTDGRGRDGEKNKHCRGTSGAQ